MRHIDDYDDEIKERERIRIGINFNFKSMYMLIGRVIEEKGEYDEHYPKNGLLKLWGCAMFAIFVLIIFTQSLFMVVTCPFLFFYGFIVIQVFKAFKVFGYARWKLLLVTLLLLAAEIVSGYYIQQWIFFR